MQPDIRDDRPALYKTGHDLPFTARAARNRLLRLRLASAIDLLQRTQPARWTGNGPNLTRVARSTDQWLWLVETYAQAAA